MERKALFGISSAFALGACSAPPPDTAEILALFQGGASIEKGFSLSEKSEKVLKHVIRAKGICASSTKEHEVAEAVKELNEKIAELMQRAQEVHEISQQKVIG